jgi:hypothetical protein
MPLNMNATLESVMALFAPRVMLRPTRVMLRPTRGIGEQSQSRGRLLTIETEGGLRGNKFMANKFGADRPCLWVWGVMGRRTGAAPGMTAARTRKTGIVVYITSYLTRSIS